MAIHIVSYNDFTLPDTLRLTPLCFYLRSHLRLPSEDRNNTPYHLPQ
ncbi:hypothetical protein [Scytonema millei]|uniref:Uncharacterized protein n=1 Tax=Scytonema millei VB511283 TaxID=1245923 RepID=A0A9X5I435_9CYAN|nr:hypothetical protein [Scytonema millei]NHC35143.1 hypothetical protein [Scytonema millei VB511283]